MFHYSEGLKEYVKWVNSDKQAFHDPIVISREVKHTLGSGHACCTQVSVMSLSSLWPADCIITSILRCDCLTHCLSMLTLQQQNEFSIGSAQQNTAQLPWVRLCMSDPTIRPGSVT